MTRKGTTRLIVGVLCIGFAALLCVGLYLILTREEDDSDKEISPSSNSHTTTADTPWGVYEGTVQTAIDGSPVVRFAGIPYAQPPVGDLRFRPPKPIVQDSPSKIIIKADRFKKSCLSVTKPATHPYYDEDCLYLNIYVPGGKRDVSETFPVFIWIHGGGFIAGTVFPEPTTYVARGQVMVVTLNYRLGVFGFLTTSTNSLPANNGLWDQVLAMEWVKNNIEYFGGDSNSITIAGESAGGMSVAVHAISPVSSHLFHRAIIQSGSAYSFLTRDPTKIAEIFGKKVGCHLDLTNDTFANCLRNLSAETLLQHSLNVNTNMKEATKQLDFIWMPVIDGKIISDEPGKLIHNYTYLERLNTPRKDYLFHLNNNEGSIAIQNFWHQQPPTMSFSRSFFKDLVDYVLTTSYGVAEDQLQKIRHIVESFYITPDAVVVDRNNVIDFVADSVFFGPQLVMASRMGFCSSNLNTSNSHCDNANGTSKSYVYLFDFCPPISEDGQLPCVTHGSHVVYQFPKKKLADDAKQQLSNNLIAAMSAFSKSGQPGASIGLRWPLYDSDSQSYATISPNPDVRQYLYGYRMRLWMETIPGLLKWR